MLIQKSIKRLNTNTANISSLRALLIQKSIKQQIIIYICVIRFESFVNSEEYQTLSESKSNTPWFESFVNSEEYQTKKLV